MANYVGTERLVRCLHAVRDLATSAGGVLLVSADLTSLAEPITSMLERDFEPLELPAKEGQLVVDVFVIDGSGVLLSHASRAEEANTDPDVMAGMLSAIMNFARVSFAEGSDELRRLELGDKTIIIKQNPKFILTITIMGTAPTNIHDEIRIFLNHTEQQYNPIITHWTKNLKIFT